MEVLLKTSNNVNVWWTHKDSEPSNRQLRPDLCWVISMVTREIPGTGSQHGCSYQSLYVPLSVCPTNVSLSVCSSASPCMCLCLSVYVFFCQSLYVSLPVCLSVCLSMYVFLSVCLFIPVCVSVCLFFCLFLCLCLSVYMSVCPCMCLCLSVCPCICLCLSVPACVSAHLYLSICVCLFLCLSLHICICLSVYMPLSTWVCPSVCPYTWHIEQQHEQPQQWLGNADCYLSKTENLSGSNVRRCFSTGAEEAACRSLAFTGTSCGATDGAGARRPKHRHFWRQHGGRMDGHLLVLLRIG